MIKKAYKSKYKKAAMGLQDIAVPEQGSASSVLSSTASMGATGAQFGPWGALIGAGVGAGIGILNAKKQDKANKLALNTNQRMSSNRAVAGLDESIDQKAQVYKDGGNVVVNGKPKYRRKDGKIVKRGLWSNVYLSKKEDGVSELSKGTKTIEIEGKKTPEIHTDKNFNVKNLGTIPHSKGGNKVEASEGDVVFNTQNSLAKYNKIAAAISTGDKSTLTKEKNRLPEDDSSKYPDGVKRVAKKPKKRVITAAGTIKAIDDDIANTFSRIGKSVTGKNTKFVDKSMQGPVAPFNIASPLSIPGVGNITGNKSSSVDKPFVEVPATKKRNAVGKQGKKIAVNNTSIAPPSLSTTFGNASIGNGEGLADGFKFADSTPTAQIKTVGEGIKNNTSMSGTSNTAANVMQFAGVANNLFQGLKSEKPISEKYFDPELNKYVDRSQGLRNSSTAAMNTQNSNARNLSGGSASNVRANQQQAALSNISRQDQINEQEMSRRDAIEVSNTGLKNSAAQYNLQRKDMYQGQIDGTRAAKQAYLDQAANDIGQYGMAKQEESYMRSRDDKAAAAQLAGYNSINGRYQHKSNLDGSTYFEPDADSTITRFGQPDNNRRTKPRVGFSKGTKAVKTSKYKMK